MYDPPRTSARLLTGDTRKIFDSNIFFKTVDESHSARVLIGCKPITTFKTKNMILFTHNVNITNQGYIRAKTQIVVFLNVRPNVFIWSNVLILGPRLHDKAGGHVKRSVHF